MYLYASIIRSRPFIGQSVWFLLAGRGPPSHSALTVIIRLVLVPIVKIVLQLTSCDGDNENVVRRFRVETGERSDKDEVRFSLFLL